MHVQASQNGHHDIVQLLIAGAADVNRVATDDGTSPLFKSCQNGHVEVTRMLINHNADVTLATTGDGFQPLHTAAQVS